MTLAVSSGMPVAWLVARSAGLVAFTLLTISVSLGLLLSTRLLGQAKGKSLLAWHQTLMWTGVSMVALHGLALLLDPTMHFGLGAVLLPGSSPWRPVTVAAGIVTGWLMLALALSFHVRRRIGQKRWRVLHYAGFAAFFLGLWHALTAGTDLIDMRGLLFAGVAAAPVLWLTFARILTPRAAPRRTAPVPTPAEKTVAGDRPATITV
jgi:DMSO/TMAO reductase YedYZ heme-binding membrane subunit